MKNIKVRIPSEGYVIVDLEVEDDMDYDVDAETEANNILQIQMQYRLLTQLTSFHFSQLNVAMK